MSAGNVLRFDDARRQRREVDRLIAQARRAILDAEAGDLAAVYEADQAVGRATVLVLQHRLDLPERLRR